MIMKEKLIAALEKSAGYTLEVASAMPEASYDFKPAASVWNFNELMNHVAYTIQWMQENYFRRITTDWNPPVPFAGKKEVVDYISGSYHSLKEELNSLKEINPDQLIAVFSILEHSAHHRGQATTYLRCNNIQPPEYPF